jgi:ParB family transcriptional regulator, chromosome partitioning protein
MHHPARRSTGLSLRSPAGQDLSPTYPTRKNLGLMADRRYDRSVSRTAREDRAGAGAAGELPLPPASVGGTFPPGLTWPQEAMLTTITENATPTAALDDSAEDLPDPGAVPGPDQEHQSKPEFMDRPMIPVALLIAHPGNVREDKQADKAFCQSVTAAGIITPLEITTSPDHDGYVVVDGNIRLDAAIKAGLDAVPYVFSPDTADDAGQQYLHMLISSRFRRDLTVHEEAAALFSASEAGMSKAAIRRATGLNATEVRAGVAAGGLTAKTRELTEAHSYAWTLEDLALLAPFEDDPDAMTRILEAVEYGQPLAYVVQKVHDERQASARRDQLIADLEANGVTVLDHAPDGATSLYMLRPDQDTREDEGPGTDSPGGSPDADSESDDTASDDGSTDTEVRDEMDPAAHASCPGAIAVLRSWQQEPSWYCLDPDKHGHAPKDQSRLTPARPDGARDDAGPVDDNSGSDPSRKLVIEGNKAWDAAGKVRHRWLAEFLARKAPPAGSGTMVPQFVATQILTMPLPLCQALGGIGNTDIYQRLSGPKPDETTSAAQPRLWMLALAPIAAAYEDQMTGTSTSRATWRTDRYSQCPHADAGSWLSFLDRCGYPLSPIEQAVADSLPYQGDTPDGDQATTAEDASRTDLHSGTTPAEDPARIAPPDAASQADPGVTAPLAA